jgi:hypothetical protein
MGDRSRGFVVVLFRAVGCAAGLLAVAFLAAGIRWTIKERGDGAVAVQPPAGMTFSLSQALLFGAAVSVCIAALLLWIARRVKVGR